MATEQREMAAVDLLPVLEPQGLTGTLPEMVQGLSYDSRRVRSGDFTGPHGPLQAGEGCRCF